MLNNLITKIITICEPNNTENIEIKLRELLNQYEIKKTVSGDTHPDIQQKMNMFLLAKKMEGLSERTLNNYRKTIQDFGSYIEKPVNQVTPGDIRSWLSSRPGLKMSTLRYYISVLRTFYEYLVSEELVDVDPMRKIKLPKIEQRIPRPLSVAELEDLREGCHTLREGALLEVFYATGCRLAEIYSLNRIDIDWQERSIIVFGKGNKERIVFISERAAHALKKYLKERSDNTEALFVTERGIPRRLSQRSIHGIIKKITSRSKINKNIHPHILRHTMASTMVDQGAHLEDVQALLGHSSPNTTQVYASVSLERKKNAYNRHFVN